MNICRGGKTDCAAACPKMQYTYIYIYMCVCVCVCVCILVV